MLFSIWTTQSSPGKISCCKHWRLVWAPNSTLSRLKVAITQLASGNSISPWTAFTRGFMLPCVTNKILVFFLHNADQVFPALKHDRRRTDTWPSLDFSSFFSVWRSIFSTLISGLHLAFPVWQTCVSQSRWQTFATKKKTNQWPSKICDAT